MAKIGFEAKIEGNPLDIVRHLKGFVREVFVARYTELVAIKLRELIIEEINTGRYDTVYDNSVHGLVDFGQYKASWRVKRTFKDRMTIYTMDPKANNLEFGGAPEEYSDLKLTEIQEWAKRKGMDDQIFIKRLFNTIKSHGTVPKPAVRRSLENITRYLKPLFDEVVKEFENFGGDVDQAISGQRARDTRTGGSTE